MSAFHPGQWQKNAPHAIEYFADMMVADRTVNYLSEGGKEMGIWGPGAKELGLNGVVCQEDFRRVIEGRNPQTGQTLLQREKDNRRLYLGSVFSAPKSFSIATVIGRDERLEELFKDSIDKTMIEVSKFAAARVREIGGNDDELTGNLVDARFIHRLSRALDPALHGHVTIFNLTNTKKHGWKALQSTGIFDRQKLISEIFTGKLASGARKLGYEIEQTKDGFEILGIPQQLIDTFSKGKKKIDEAVAELIGTSDEKGHAAVRAVIAHQVRDPKREVSMDELQQRWRNEMGEEAFLQLQQLVQQARTSQSKQERPLTPEQALTLAIQHLTERASVVADHQVLTEALAVARGRVDLSALQEEMNAPKHCLIFGIPNTLGTRKLTTKALLEAEQYVLSFAREGVGCVLPLLPAIVRETRPRDPILSQEQKQAVDLLLSSRDRVTLLLGKAGTGKSTSLRDLIAGLHLAGHVVIGCAPQAKQVIELKNIGLSESRTLASILERGVLPAGAVVILDEAGQVGTLDFSRLVRMVEAAHGRLILSGDTKQHGAVCAGDMLRLLEGHSGCDLARIKTIQRQKDELYKLAVNRLSNHQSLDAWDLLDHSDKITELPSDERRQALAQWVASGLNEGKDMLTVAPTWAEIDHVTNAIRNQLVSTGHLGHEKKKVMVSERIDFTNAQRKQARCYSVGMEIIERRGLNLRQKRMEIKRIQGEALVLIDDQDKEQLVDLKQLSTKASWTVHRPREIELRIGDRLLLQQNDKTHGYTNGDLVTVTGFTADTIQLSNGKQIGRDYTQFTYGWAVTSYASQGLTCDRVAVSYDQSSYAGIDRRGFYVASSRAKEDLRIFVDDKDFVRDCLRRNTGDRETASEFVSQMLPEQLQQRLLWERLLHQQNKETIQKQETQEINIQPDTLALER